jgi:hypothetical protein
MQRNALNNDNNDTTIHPTPRSELDVSNSNQNATWEPRPLHMVTEHVAAIPKNKGIKLLVHELAWMTPL